MLYSYRLNAAIILPVAVSGSFFNQAMMNLYGGGSSTGWATLVFTLTASGIAAFLAPTAQVLLAAGKIRKIARLMAWFCKPILNADAIARLWRRVSRKTQSAFSERRGTP